MTSLWQEWKAKNVARQEAGIVTPTALLNPDTPRVSDERAEERMAICTNCPYLLPTNQCSECWCFMPAKVKLLHAVCPKELW